MSLSWSRIIPQGGKGDLINKEGVQFYRKVLKALLDAGIVSGEILSSGSLASWFDLGSFYADSLRSECNRRNTWPNINLTAHKP
jgi:beta-glucosidase